jgi:hypothetical protein
MGPPTAVDDLAESKGRSYRGIAKVRLQALNFDHYLVRKERRDVSAKNVHHLQKVFRLNGCQRLRKENFVNAVIDDETLRASLSLSGTSEDQLRQLREGDQIPMLDVASLDCLEGLHRVLAAKGYLHDNDQWWIVRLYTKGIAEIRTLHVQAEQMTRSSGIGSTKDHRGLFERREAL